MGVGRRKRNVRAATSLEVGGEHFQELILHGGALNAYHQVKDAKLKRLHNSNHMTFWKRLNYGDNKRTSGCQGSGEGRGYAGTEDF